MLKNSNALKVQHLGENVTLPFLKWAGGKRWFVQNHSELLPDDFNNYYEPFLGSGATFFHLSPNNAILSDANPRLIETYRAIQSDPGKITALLRLHQKLHSKEYYYETRAKKCRNSFTRAAQFIYLNRTCFNGLYRENKKGIFNVPIGTKTNVLLSTDDFFSVSEALSNVKLNCCDFEETILNAGDGDLIFVDPPYTTAHNHNGFVKYNQNIFSWKDQLRLKEVLISARAKGAIIIMTNAAHDSIHDIYSDIADIRNLSRRSVMSGNNNGRSVTSEYLIRLA